MYHCHTRFYLAGQTNRAFDIIKKAAPLDHFTHEFSESGDVKEALVFDADVIFLNLQDQNTDSVFSLLETKRKKDAELIVLAEKDRIPSLAQYMTKIKDIWIMPLSDEEASFRFLKWQKDYKTGADFWQTKQYLDATINNVPSLVWYKDKDGVHKKVNDSFCRTVNKTKSQVEGQRHAYIWDVEFDDPACIESEREVMEKKETIISEETIKSGKEMRLLTTYKSPLYDIDGSVMGTVGVANDITEKHAFEQEIIRKNKMLETLFTTTDCGIINHSIDGTKILDINTAALKILG